MNTTKTKTISLAIAAVALLGCGHHLVAAPLGSVDVAKCKTVTVSNFKPSKYITAARIKVLRCSVSLNPDDVLSKALAIVKSRQVMKGWSPVARAADADTVDLRGMHKGELKNLRLVRAK